MKRVLLSISLLFSIFNSYSQEHNDIFFDKDWSFIQEDFINGDSVQLDDSNWNKVKVPHDWAIAGNFDMDIDMQSVMVIE
jgi:beta-galactosidase